jgi:glycosyltransferase involved in cell wall biosynthesis
MKIAIGSLKFSPVFKSHCLALGRQCEKNGFNIIYIFSNDYRYLIPDHIINKCIFFDTSTKFSGLLIDCAKIKNNKKINDLFNIHEVTHVYMFNYHPLNHKIAKDARRNGAKYIQHIHEVSVDPINYKFFYGYLVKIIYEFLIKNLISNSDVIVVSSEKILNLFNNKYNNFAKKVRLIPLIYADSKLDTTTGLRRKYVTFIGPPIPSKNIELFYDLINYGIDNKLSYDFLIISRKPIKLPANIVSNARLYYKEKISDEDIESLILSSIATVVPYKRISQSSNVNTSYRCGTPVIGSNIPGLKQFVIPGKTGCLVDLDAPIELWADRLSYISENFEKLSNNCKEYYDTNFAERNWEKYIMCLFK